MRSEPRGYDVRMLSFGVALPTMRAGASGELIEAAAETADRLGWSTVWTTDHLLVPASSATEYGRIYEAITTLAWVGARHPRLRLGTSVIVVPQRNAVVLAKELATLDALSGGRVLAGVGAGWNAAEFANLTATERFTRRGAYLDETIRLWRHLWSGSREPFVGAFHEIRDFAFEPLPAQGANLPVIVGGHSPAALRRAGMLGDGYQSSSTGPEAYGQRVPLIRAAAVGAGRPMPALAARVSVEDGAPGGGGYRLSGSPADMLAEVRAFAGLGVEHLAVGFEPREPERYVAAMERFDREVAHGADA
jgi:probable F420-dependent oxidoreductase